MTLREGRVALRPISRSDREAWTHVRNQNRSWLAPWEATPPRDLGPPVSFTTLVRTLRTQARRGQLLPFVVTPKSAMSNFRSSSTLLPYLNGVATPLS